MTGLKIYNLFFLIITAKNILCQSTQYSAEELKIIDELKTSTNIADKLKYSIIENLNIIPQHYITSAANATQYLLKDQTLQDNSEPEVLEFKKNLTQYLDKHAPSMANIQASYTAMIDFGQMINPYYELSENELTPETKLIIKLMNKYNCKTIAGNMSDHYEKFLLDVSKMLEENKTHMDKP
ncbi:uncharacterized protein LOC111685855 [Lucilia cuprina]|uniref:uncharacterized protein LOC111685855 n=1 Tax=Lucilia cuprina TaxID=7375 RepID=UPI001F0710A3|nr:uncharacterized protein LOC111685855 [Lucilia cuprina]